MGTLWLAELFGLTPDWAAVWASVGADTSKGAAKAATLITIAKRFILLSPSTRLAAFIDRRDARKPEFLQALEAGRRSSRTPDFGLMSPLPKVLKGELMKLTALRSVAIIAEELGRDARRLAQATRLVESDHMR